MRKKILTLITILLLIAIIIYPQAAVFGAREGIDICVNIIIPSLLPFMMLVRILISLGFARKISRFCSPIMRPLFGVNGSGAFAFFTGILSGYPMGAKIAVDMLDDGMCSKTEAQRILGFCNNSGPLFVVGAIGVGVYKSPQIGAYLYIAHVASAITIGFLLKFFKREKQFLNKATIQPRASSNLSVIIKESVVLLGTICGYIILFSVIIRIIQIPISRIALPPAIASTIYGIIEMTKGVSIMPHTADYLPLTAALITFSGVCVILQVAGIISGKGLSKKIFVASKAVQAAICALYTYIILKIFPLTESVFLTNNAPIANLTLQKGAYLYSFVLCILCVALCLLTAIIPQIICRTE